MEKGRTWRNRETKLLLEIWSEERIQSQLRGAVWNNNVFHMIAEDLAKQGFQRTVAQCQAKIKALNKKYKSIVDRMRRNGAGRESDEESDLPSDFPFFEAMDAVMGGRAAVIPVHLLDSAASCSPETAEAAGDVSTQDATTEGVGQSTTPSPSAISHPSTPGPSGISHPSTPGPSGISRPSTPGPSGLSRPSTPVPDDDFPVPKKKRKRVTSVQRAEKAASSLVKDVLVAQAKGRDKREEAAKKAAAKEEAREKRFDEREQ